MLEELDQSGTGSLEFRQRVWRALTYLSDEDLVRLRLARTVGPAARVSLRRLGVAETRFV